MRRQTSTAFAGPFALARGALVKAGFLALLILVLTAITQIGGVVLWFCIPAFVWAGHRLDRHGFPVRAGACIGIFLCAYLGASIATVPLSGAFGRAPLPCGLLGEASYGPETVWTCLLNRHYVQLPAREALQRVSSEFSGENRGFQIAYLDAGFPFFDWFLMIPHVSHGDGLKVDLALFFEGGAGTPSPVGYWGFVQRRPGDPQPCIGREGWLRWDMGWLQPLIPNLPLDAQRTRAILMRLAAAPSVHRVFIEPHLRARLGLDHANFRFQGCAAARHEDHIHVEFQPQTGLVETRPVRSGDS